MAMMIVQAISFAIYLSLPPEFFIFKVGEVKYFDFSSVAIFWLCIFSFIISTFLGESLVLEGHFRLVKNNDRLLFLIFKFSVIVSVGTCLLMLLNGIRVESLSYIISITANLQWGGNKTDPFVGNGKLFFSGLRFFLEISFICAFILHFIYRKKISYVYWLLMLFGVVFRYVCLTDRLQIMYIAISFLCIRVAGRERRHLFRCFSTIFVFLIAVFIFAAYLRGINRSGNFFSVVLSSIISLTGYIASGINHTIYIIAHNEGINELSHVFSFFYTAFLDSAPVDKFNILVFGLNCHGGVGYTWADLGYVAFFYWILYGIIVGIFYELFRRRISVGLILYPLLLGTIADSYRTLQFSHGNIVIPSAFVLLFYFVTYSAIISKRKTVGVA